LSDEVLVFVLLLDDDGCYLCYGVVLSLFVEYNVVIDGFEIGLLVGLCGIVVYCGVCVVVEDIECDLLW